MAIPYENDELRSVSQQAELANALTASARMLLKMLVDELPGSAAKGYASFKEVTFGDNLKDFSLETPLGEVWGKFGFGIEQGRLIGRLTLQAVGQGAAGGIHLTPLHAMAYSQHGYASFQFPSDDDWDWSTHGDILTPQAAARTFVNVIFLKQVDQLPK